MLFRSSGNPNTFKLSAYSLLDFGASDDMTLVAIVRNWATFGTNDVILAKKNSSTASVSAYSLTNDGTTAALGRFQIGDNTNGTSAVTSASRTSGALNVLAGVRSVSSDNTILYANGTAGTSVTDTTTGSLSSLLTLNVGRLSESATEYNDFEFVSAAIFRRALTATEVATLNNYFQGRVA